MLKFEKCPFNLLPFLRHWYSVETDSFRLSIGFGKYKEFYAMKTILKKWRFCFYYCEIIFLTKGK